MTIQTKQFFTASGKIYAVGLFWQPLQDKKNPIVEIEKISKSLIPNPLFYCIKTFGVSQYGLAFANKGHKDKMFIAGIALTSALKEKSSILSCLKVDTGWWICASRNGLILPEDDCLYTSVEEAKKHFLRLNELPSWDYKIAPQDWNLNDTSPITIDELLEKSLSLRLTPLKQIAGSRKLFYIGLFIIITLFFYKDSIFNMLFPEKPKVVVNHVLIEKYKDPVEEEKLKKQETEQKVLLPESFEQVQIEQNKLIKEENKIPYSHDLNNIKEFCLICKNAVSFYSTPIYGWNLEEVVCDKKEIKVVYKRNAGDISVIVKAFEKFIKPVILDYTLEFNDNGDMATSIIKQAEFSKNSSQADQKEHELKNRLLTLSQRTNTKIQTNYEKEENSENKTHYSYLTFTFNSKLDIMEWANVFDTMNATEFNQIIWDNRNQTWKIKGRVYEKN